MITLRLLIKWEQESAFDTETILWKKVMHSFQVIRTKPYLPHCNLAFFSGNYNEQLRVIDFPVYISGQNDPNLTPLVPAN